MSRKNDFYCSYNYFFLKVTLPGKKKSFRCIIKLLTCIIIHVPIFAHIYIRIYILAQLRTEVVTHTYIDIYEYELSIIKCLKYIFENICVFSLWFDVSTSLWMYWALYDSHTYISQIREYIQSKKWIFSIKQWISWEGMLQATFHII